MAGHIGQLLSPRHQQAELGITAFLGHLWKISFERLLLFMPNVRNGSNAVSPMLKFFLDEKQVAQKQCTLGPSARRRLIRRLILSH